MAPLLAVIEVMMKYSSSFRVFIETPVQSSLSPHSRARHLSDSDSDLISLLFLSVPRLVCDTVSSLCNAFLHWHQCREFWIATIAQLSPELRTGCAGSVCLWPHFIHFSKACSSLSSELRSRPSSDTLLNNKAGVCQSDADLWALQHYTLQHCITTALYRSLGNRWLVVVKRKY